MEFNEKQLQIIGTAERLFANKGFDGTSVRDIADEADINIAMISYYFGSKEKLMEAIFEERMGHVKMRVGSLINDSSITPIAKVNILIDDHIERVMQKQNFSRLMLCELVTNKNPIVVKAANQLKVKNAEVVNELIKDGQAKGDFKKNIDVVLMLNTMFGTVWQAMISQDYYREFYKLESLSDEEFQKLLKRKLSIHLKTLFKAILTNEA